MTYFCLGENPHHHQQERRARSPSPPHNKVNSRRRLHSLSDVPVIQYHPLPPLYFAKTQNASLQLNQHPLFKAQASMHVINQEKIRLKLFSESALIAVVKIFTHG